MTDDDGSAESGPPSDPGAGLGGTPGPGAGLGGTPDPGAGLGGTPDPGPGLGRTPGAPPGARGARSPRHPRFALPGFGVAHPGAPGPAVAPADPQPAVPLVPATAAGSAPAGPGVPAPPAATVPAAGRTAYTGATASPDGTAPPLDIDQIASQVYERIGDKMDHRPDTAQDTPPAEQAIMLRDKAPELYDLWLKIAQEKAATSNYVQRAPYEVPERLAQSGRPRALSAMIVVLAFCGYLASLGGPGPYIGGLIAILDLLVMLALFFGLRPDHLTDSSRPRKRRLIRAPLAY